MWWPGYAPAATTALGWGSVLLPAPLCVPVSQVPAQRNWLWLPWFYLFGINLNLYVMLQSCFHTWLDCKLERECAFLTTAKYDWRWGYHTSCSLLLNGYGACGWLRTWADGQIRQIHRSYAGRLFPAYSPLQLGLKDTCSKCLRAGLSVHHLLEHCSAENLAACPGRVAVPSTSSCWKPRDDDDSEAGVCWLGELFHQVSELIQLTHGCTRALGKTG